MMLIAKAPDEALYYECHITVEPLVAAPAKLTAFKHLCKEWGFRPADLVMLKADGGATPSGKDTFCTGRDKDFRTLRGHMDSLIQLLENRGITVWRAKIEAVIHDQRFYPATTDHKGY